MRNEMSIDVKAFFRAEIISTRIDLGKVVNEVKGTGINRFNLLEQKKYDSANILIFR
jgi:hypothetical protein